MDCSEIQFKLIPKGSSGLCGKGGEGRAFCSSQPSMRAALVLPIAYTRHRCETSALNRCAEKNFVYTHICIWA